MENQIQEQLLTWINTSLEAISINLEVFRKSEDKETVRKIEEKINDWFFDLEMNIQKTPKISINLDYSPNVDYTLIHSEENNEEKKAYIYLTGHEDKKIYIDGDTCYEVSERIPGLFTFGEAQKIVKLIFNKDWKLPNKEELRLICENLINNEFIQDTNDYWSSSSYSNDGAWLQSFRDRNQYYNKNNLCSVRAVRSFKR